jgi:hypothetical protein
MLLGGSVVAVLVAFVVNQLIALRATAGFEPRLLPAPGLFSAGAMALTQPV